MEQLTMSWNNMSLSGKEKIYFILPEDHRKGEFVIAAKFLTSRFLQMEAVANMWIQSKGALTTNQQEFDSFLRAPRYKSSGKDVVYVPGYYEERCGKAREKKAELAAHAVARVASAVRMPSTAEQDRDTKGSGESINSVSMELNAEVNVQEKCVTDGLQVDVSLIASLKEKLLHHNCSVFPSESVLVQKLNNDSSEIAITDKGRKAPRITEVNAGDFRFNAICINSQNIQRTPSSSEKTLADPSINGYDFNHSLPSTVEITGITNNLRTWKPNQPSQPPPRLIWKPPPWSKIKVNFDWEMFREDILADVGVIVRNGEGSVMASMIESFQLPFLITAVKVIAAKKAPQFAFDLCHSSIVLEGDSKITIDGLRREELALAEYGHLLEEAKDKAKQFPEVEFNHMLRLASCSQKIPLAYKAKEIEALAALKALSFAFELGFRSATLEGDSLGLSQALKSEEHSLSPTGLLIEDMKVFANNFVKLLYSHIKRNGNRVAHSLVKNALCIPDFQVYMEDVPSRFVLILQLDVVELH